MKRKEYIANISQKLNLTKKEVELVTDAFIEELITALSKKDMVTITNFGTFRKSIIKDFECFSPVDGKKMKIDVAKVTFSLSKELSRRLLGVDK